MRWLDLEVEGRVIRVPAIRAAGRLWYHFRGRTRVVEAAPARGGGARRPDRASASPGIISAPMPGKITRVAVTVGTGVTKDQVLVVMEAMKMEYTLTADVDGRVAMCDVTVGATVKQGDVLVKVTPP